jgi:peptidoglycan/xylan/chitin deacetylase (PgdA/CDA1 family)
MKDMTHAVRVPILTYHQIDHIPPKRDETGARTPYRSLIVSPSSFARQMWLLKTLGYRGVNMSEVMQYLRGDKRAALHGKVVGITFDDGYHNNLLHAQPVLARYGFSSTCYAVSDMSGGLNTWDAEKGIGAKRLMTQEQLREWIAGGQEIGSHTQHHVDLPTLDMAMARAEIFTSKVQLEAITGVPCRHFCYPYGYFDASHATMVGEAGYDSATTTLHGVAASLDSAFELPRLGVLKNTTLFKFWRMTQA